MTSKQSIEFRKNFYLYHVKCARNAGYLRCGQKVGIEICDVYCRLVAIKRLVNSRVRKIRSTRRNVVFNAQRDFTKIIA